MVTRIFLDEGSVEFAQVPSIGERWISDTKVKGFGLRLFNSKSAPTKRFCIRTVDKQGKSVRKTFNEWTARYEHYQKWQWKHAFSDEKPEFNWNEPIGRYSAEARKWATNEIWLLKGLRTVATEDQDRATDFSEKLKEITLDRSVQAVLANYRKMKMSTAYVDKLDKLFVTLIPADLRNKMMRDISEADALKIHQSINLLPGNRRTMMPFLGRVFEVYQALARGRNEFAIAKDHLRRAPIERRFNFQIDGRNADKIQHLAHLLETESVNWQQGICLRLYLAGHFPLSRFLAARWDQLYEVTFSNEKTKRLEWKYGDKARQFERFSKKEEELIWRLFDLGRTEFGENPFWFPSGSGRTTDHIKSIAQFWSKSLNLIGLRYVSPRSMRITIQEFGVWRIFPENAVSLSNLVADDEV